MDRFYRKATKSTPEVLFDPDKNTLNISGESYPENSFSFYKPIYEHMENVLAELDTLTLNIQVNYLNTSSTKAFMNLLDIMEHNYQNGKNIIINWYYEKDNEHSYELALDFNEYLDLPFNIIPLD